MIRRPVHLSWYRPASSVYRFLETSQFSFERKSELNCLWEILVVGDILCGLGRWSDEYEIRTFHFRKMCERASAEYPWTLTSMNKLANVLSNQGKYEQAEETHRQALGLSETVLGKEYPFTLTSMKPYMTTLFPLAPPFDS